MPVWKHVTEDPPHSREVMLWLRAPDGEEQPLGCVIGVYVENNFFTGWAEKTVTGNINAGLQQNLVTHWSELDAGPEI